LRVVVYTTAPWEHALAVLRFVGPANLCGVELIKGTPNPNSLLDADLILIQRDFPRNIDATLQILQKGREFGKPVVYDLDDLLIALPEDHPDRLAHYYTSALIPILNTIMQSDAVTVSTPKLSEYLTPLNPHIWVLPNYLNEDVWNIDLHK
jgi:hypothetical protein